MLKDFQKDPEGIAGKYQFEQRYVTNCVKGGVKFWPSGLVKHFRMNCLGPWPLRYIRPAVLPKDCRIVIFPGKPDPEDAIAGRWRPEHPVRNRWEHIKHVFSKDFKRSRYKGLKHFVLPVPWVKEYWRE